MGSLFQELKRRKVYNVITIYIVTSWLLLQVAETLFPAFGLPDSAIRIPATILLIGFPLVAILAWVFELTPRGIKKTSAATPEDTVKIRKRDYLVNAIVLVLIAVVAVQQFAFFNRPTSDDSIDKSIAVLPFVSISSGEEDGYFADGLTEELLNVLTQISDLKVAARTSSFYYKGRNEDIREIGSALDVAHVLEGSVRRSVDQIRVTAQLINVETGFHLWSATYDGDLNDIFAIQDEIANEVTAALRIQLFGEEATALQSHGTQNAEAQTLYLIAMARLEEHKYINFQNSPEGIGRTRQLFEEITQLDPDFADAWAGLTELLLMVSSNGLDDGTGIQLGYEEGLELAGHALRRAQVLAPESIATLLAEAAFKTRSLEVSDFENSTAMVMAGMSFYDAVLSADPNNITALVFVASRLSYLGKNDEALLKVYDQILAIDPLSRTMISRANLVSKIDPDLARRQYKRVGDIYPNMNWQEGIAEIEMQLGHFHHAILWLKNRILPNALNYSLGAESNNFFGLNEIAPSGGSLGMVVRINDLFYQRDYEAIVELSEDGQDVISAQSGALETALFKLRRFEEQILVTNDRIAEMGVTFQQLLQFISLGQNSIAIQLSHALRMTGDIENSRAINVKIRENLAADLNLELTADSRIFHEMNMLLLASEGRVEEALTEFELMIEDGWRWLAGFGPVHNGHQKRTNSFFWFDDSPILDSIRDEPRFIAGLDFVKTENAAMLAELEAGLKLEDILDE